MYQVLPRKLAAGVLLLCASAVVCAAEGQPASAAPPPVAPATAVVDDQYLIGAGDMLQVYVFQNSELTVTVPVRPDGKISTPLVDNMVAVGKTPSQLAKDIEKVLGEYVRTPSVNVIVTQAISALSQVKIIGQVNQPKSIPYHAGMTAIDAVLAANGLTQFAAGNRAKIVRSENGKQVEIHIKLVNLMEKGDMKQNVALRPGDVLVVPETLF